MGKTWTKKLLCFSLLYLSASLFFVLYRSQCLFLFRTSPLEPIQAPLFSFPSSYGDTKYAIQTIRSNCSSPVFFSDYQTAVKEIGELCEASSSYSSGLTYMQGKADSFGGNFSAPNRFSYFDHRNVTSELPCGFFKDFPISDSDRIALESCRGVVMVSAIFNDHDKIRQPRGLGSETLKNACFYVFVDDVTVKGFERHKLISRDYTVGVWKIVKVLSENLYDNPAMNGVIPKYLVHRLFPNAKFSIWVDAKLRLTVDPMLLIHSLVVSENADMAISKHPFYVHTMEEAVATARWKKWWDVDGLRRQMETYCELGLKPWSSNKLPYSSDVPDSALIIRRHGVGSDHFSCLLFNELEGFNPRDQLPFAYVRDNMASKLKLNMFEPEVFEHIAIEYRHSLNTGSRNTGGPARRRRWTNGVGEDRSFVNGSCKDYLLEMWSHSHH